MRRVVGKQVRIISQPDTGRREFCLDLSSVAHDQRTGDRVDGKPAVLVGLGVLTNAAAAANDVAGRNVHRVGRVGLEPTTGGL